MQGILQGILFGLFLNIFIGVTFFALIETSISRGFKSALVMRFGVLLSDLIILASVYFLASEVISSIIENQYFRNITGLLLAAFGCFYIFRNHISSKSSEILISNSSLLRKCFANGFLINTLNPAVFAIWLGAMALAINRFSDVATQAFFFISTFLVFVSGDIFKIYFASKLRNFFTPALMSKIYFITGIILILFGLKIMII